MQDIENVLFLPTVETVIITILCDIQQVPKCTAAFFLSLTLIPHVIDMNEF